MLLNQDRLLLAAQACIAAGLFPARETLRGFIDPLVAAGLGTPLPGASETIKLVTDLQELNKLPPTADGTLWLVRWLEAAQQLAIATHPAEAELLGLLAVEASNARPAPGTVAGPIETQLLYRRVPLLDRRALRAALAELSENPKPCTLLVRGPQGSGRTRAGDFVEWFALKLGEQVQRVDLDAAEPYDLLLGSLRTRIARSDTRHDPSGFRPPYKFGPMAEMVSDWFREKNKKIEEANGQPVRTWLVLDRLDGATPDMLDFVDALVSKLSASDLLRYVRVVLLAGQDHSEPPASVGSVTVEDIDYETITESDLEDFLDWFYEAELGAELPSPTRVVLVRDLIPPPDRTEAQRVKFIGEAAATLAERLRDEPAPP